MLYVFNINNDVYDKMNTSLVIEKYFISHYDIPLINGAITENIFHRHININTLTVSKNITSTEIIYGCIVKPDYKNIIFNYDTFISLNWFDNEYIKHILSITNYYDIFDYSKLPNIRLDFNKKINNMSIDEKIKIFNIEINFNKFIASKIPFKYVIIEQNEVDSFIHKCNCQIDDINWNNYYADDNKITDRNTDDGEIEISNNINYLLTEIRFGFGDFIQRYNKHLQPILNYCSNKFILVNNKNYSYNNRIHNNKKFFGMYYFPGFNFAEKNDDIDIKNIVFINYSIFAELIMYDKCFFSNLNKDYFLGINLSSCPIQGYNNNNINYNCKLMKEKQEVMNTRICSLSTMFNKDEFKKASFTGNETVLVHFRRGDYVDTCLKVDNNGRTMNTFNYILDILCERLYKRGIYIVDIVIMSDHYNYTKLTCDNKKYIPVLFDYNDIKIGSKIQNKGVTVNIVDSIIGENDETNEYNIIKYLSSSKYIIGNMSCFPNIIAESLGNNIENLSRDIVPNIRNKNDLEYLLNHTDYNTPSLLKYLKGVII